MLIALLADIHANDEALSACLAHASSRGAGQHVFLGDLVGYGADPGRVVDTIMSFVDRGGVAILGNHDAAVARAALDGMNADACKVVEWTRRRLNAAQLAFLDGLPVEVEQEGRLYVHANAWAPIEWEYVLGTFDAERSLRATRSRLTFCGHVHEPALYHMAANGRVAGFTPVPGTGIPLGQRRRWLAIPGSAGQPRDGIPAACYALFDDATGVLTYFRVPYDHLAAARKVREAGLPQRLGLRLEAGL
jgi:diadenosine tetraphosphatase ApaH/serine/threonine PP2A family protein phosphatase